MQLPEKPPEEALRRLDERLDALAVSTRREPRRFEMESSGVGYRLIAELIAGVLTGLGLGWLLDRVAGTSPFGLIGGVLIGAAGSIYMVARSAGRMSKAAEAQPVPGPARPSGEDQDGPG